MRVRRGGLVAGVAATGLALLMGGLAVPAAAADTVDCSTVPWMDASASSDARAAALLAASSQHQKYRCTLGGRLPPAPGWAMAAFPMIGPLSRTAGASLFQLGWSGG